MTTLDLNNKTCVPSLKLLGDFWTLRIIDALSDGEMHYCDIQRVAGNVNPATLATKLKNLTSAGLVERHATSRTDVTYKLTRIGREILPVLEAIDAFAKKAKSHHKIK